MNRRSLLAKTAAFISLAASVWLSSSAQAQVRQPVAGTDFLPLPRMAPVETPKGKIEVVEFFRYDCPHCNGFEPSFDAWVRKAPKDVVVRRIPAGFDESQIGLQRLYYTLEALNKLDELHRKAFAAIHVEHLPMRTTDQISAWAEKQGLNKAKFLELFNSFTITNKAHKASLLADAYKISGVPSLGIAGRFVTDGEMAGNNDKALFVTEYLIAEVRKGH